MNLSERINNLLKETGWTYYKLAKISGVARTTLENIVNGRGKTTSHENMQKIAAAFGITVSDLLDEKEPEVMNLENCYIEVAKEAQDKKIDPEKLFALIKILQKENDK